MMTLLTVILVFYFLLLAQTFGDTDNVEQERNRGRTRRAWTVHYQGTAIMVVLVHGWLSLMFFSYFIFVHR
jgi:hypothetical protein